MNVKQIICIILILLLLAFAAICAEDALKGAEAVANSNGITVVIDPGHGGSDPGAVSEDGTREAELNVAVSMYLREYLREKGFSVLMTHEKEGLTKDERKARITGAEPDIVISIHMNKYSDGSVYGAETYYYGKSEGGKALAEYIQTSLKNELDKTNRRTVRSADNLFVLKASTAPSVLVECGYISNENERNKLLTPEYQKKTAFAIYCGIMAYLQSR